MGTRHGRGTGKHPQRASRKRGLTDADYMAVAHLRRVDAARALGVSAPAVCKALVKMRRAR